MLLSAFSTSANPLMIARVGFQQPAARRGLVALSAEATVIENRCDQSGGQRL
jgi:hypothetical protein